MSSDAIVVGEEWISEHYFTTDATKESFKARVLARRSDWDAIKEQGNPRTRFTAARTSLLNRLATLDATTNDHASDVRAINADVRAILGYDGIGLTRTVQGPVTFVHAAGLEHTPGLAIIDALPAETIEDLLAKDASNLAEPFLPAGVDADDADAATDHKDAVTSVARLLSLLFVHDDYKPAFALVLAGPHLLVAERERWPEGRYLAVDLQLVAERNDDKKGGEVDRALTCVAADSLAPDAQGDIWWSADAGGVGQAHGRGEQGPARGRAALHRDHRQRGGGPPQGRRASTRFRRRRRSPSPSSRCGSSTGSSSCSTPRRPPSWACCRPVPRSTRTATASTGCASSSWSSCPPSARRRAPTSTSRSAPSSGWSTRGTTRRRAGGAER